jgi:hypothetical protein
VIVVASVTVYVRVPYVKVVGDGHTIVYISVVRVVYWMSAVFRVRVGGLSVCEDVMVMSIHVGFGIVVVKPLL